MLVTTRMIRLMVTTFVSLPQESTRRPCNIDEHRPEPVSRPAALDMSRDLSPNAHRIAIWNRRLVATDDNRVSNYFGVSFRSHRRVSMSAPFEGSEIERILLHFVVSGRSPRLHSVIVV
jgi:hypothetical protein